MYIFPVYNVFVCVLEGEVHKDCKLENLTNVGKNRLVKVSLQNACANSFGRYIMIA